MAVNCMCVDGGKMRQAAMEDDIFVSCGLSLFL